MSRANEPQKSVLIVEDHFDTAETLAMILEREGYSVRCVSTAGQAFQALTGEANGIDAILLDLTLPDINGEDFIRSLRLQGTPLPPVLIMSAHPDSYLRQAAQSINAAGIVPKPFDIEVLLESLSSVLG